MNLILTIGEKNKYMIVTNYNRGYQSWCDCVIHGTIKVNKKKALDIMAMYLDSPYLRSIINKKGLITHFMVGGTATNEIVKRAQIISGREKYRRGNYQFKIIY